MNDGYRALYMSQISSFPSESQWSSRSITKSRMEYLVLHFLKKFENEWKLSGSVSGKDFQSRSQTDDLYLIFRFWRPVIADILYEKFWKSLRQKDTIVYLKEFNSTYYDEIVNDGRCCDYWKTEGFDLSDGQDHDDWPQRNCDWNGGDCSNSDHCSDGVPLLVIVIFGPFILSIVCAPCLCAMSQRSNQPNQSSTPSNQWASNRPEAAETPAPPLFAQPAMPPPPPIAAVTMQPYQDLPPPPTYQPPAYRY